MIDLLDNSKHVHIWNVKGTRCVFCSKSNPDYKLVKENRLFKFICHTLSRGIDKALNFEPDPKSIYEQKTEERTIYIKLK